MKKRFTYKGFTCIWDKDKQCYLIFTKDEMEQPKDFRNVEMECETEILCKEFIDSY